MRRATRRSGTRPWPGLRAAWLLAALAAAAGPAAAQDADRRVEGRAVGAPGVSGPYLKARAAARESDFALAASQFALAMMRDPAERGLAEAAVEAYLASGDVGRAAVVARALEAGRPEDAEPVQLAQIALLVEAARGGEWRAIADGAFVAGTLTDGLARAWARVGLGDRAAAEAEFAALAADPALAPHAALHEALAWAALGDWGRSAAVFEGSEARPAVPLTLRTAMMRAAVDSRAGRGAEAADLLERLAEAGDRPDLRPAAEAARAGEALPHDGPADAAGGLAEAFHTLADALSGEGPDAGSEARMDPQALVYARAALALRPDHAGAAILAGSLLRDMGRTEESLKAYAVVRPGHAGHPDAAIGRALTLRAAGRDGEAIALLEALRMSRPGLPKAHAALGDALRGAERLGDAAAAYDRAVAAHGGAEAAPWSLLYRRAVVRERAGDWEGARADLRLALSMRPSEVQLLNHLGYTMVERGEGLTEALAMVRRASELAPHNGHVTDSLGWALFRLGRHEEAVEALERAAVQEPLQWEILDHLGDALWAVGREREARFQWRRALGLEPDAEAAGAMRRKLAHGPSAPGPSDEGDAEAGAATDPDGRVARGR